MTNYLDEAQDSLGRALAHMKDIEGPDHLAFFHLQAAQVRALIVIANELMTMNAYKLHEIEARERNEEKASNKNSPPGLGATAGQ